jgi:hypothetical protein
MHLLAGNAAAEDNSDLFPGEKEAIEPKICGLHPKENLARTRAGLFPGVSPHLRSAAELPRAPKVALGWRATPHTDHR